MRFTKTLVAAAALSTFAMTASAGGLAPVAMEAAPMDDMVVMAPHAGGSLSSGYVVLGLLAALVAASGSF